MSLEWNLLRGQMLDRRNIAQAQRFVDSECLRYAAQFVPHDTGLLIRTGQIATRPGSGEVIYRTPYARRWYYEPARFQGAPIRGNAWFDRMKQSYKNVILKGAANIMGVRPE